MDLGDTVDGGRPHDGEIWGVLARSRGPKGTNGAGAKHAEIVDPGCSAKEEKREKSVRIHDPSLLFKETRSSPSSMTFWKPLMFTSRAFSTIFSPMALSKAEK